MRTVFDRELIKKYDRPGPRYTSYPPATEFTEEVGEEDYRRKLMESNARGTPLSLYFHIPFCESGCYYCGCNIIISHRKGIEIPYLHRVYREMDMLVDLLDSQRKVVQLHWGGGTPNYLTSQEIEELQKAINRIQPFSLMVETMEKLRDLGFQSVNIDLIYGLPHQTRSSFEKTVEKVIELNPDRIAVYSFAYVPWVKPIQKRIDPESLPSAEEKLSILEMVVEKFQDAGYVYIGMDHFAKIGATSIGMLYDSYFQNFKTLREYNVAVDEGRLPTYRGFLLKEDDFIRREVIMDIMCNLGVSFGKIEAMFGIRFEDYFSKELEDLRELEEDGLIKVRNRRIEILPVGRMLIRNIAMVFDAYLKTRKELKFSKTI